MPAGARQQQVIAAFREAMVLWTRSEVKDRLVAPVREYVSGTALHRNLMDVIASSVKYGTGRWGGTACGTRKSPGWPRALP